MAGLQANLVLVCSVIFGEEGEHREVIEVCCNTGVGRSSLLRAKHLQNCSDSYTLWKHVGGSIEIAFCCEIDIVKMLPPTAGLSLTRILVPAAVPVVKTWDLTRESSAKWAQ